MTAEPSRVPAKPGDDGRAALIATGERLIAERGTATVSMRMVCEAAGHRNHSAVQFHFGSRDGLLRAIAAERMGPITERRQEMLAELDRVTGPAIGSMAVHFGRTRLIDNVVFAD